MCSFIADFLLRFRIDFCSAGLMIAVVTVTEVVIFTDLKTEAVLIEICFGFKAILTIAAKEFAFQWFV